MYKLAPFLALLLFAGCSDMLTESDANSASTSETVLATDDARLPKAGYALYAVTVENLTDGQPLTPPTLATHRQPVDLFEVGTPASKAIQEIAENGNLDPMLDFLQNNKHVEEVVVAAAAGPPPILPGESVSAQIGSAEGSKYLSYASMLVCTNDGFTGVNGVRLPKRVGDVVVMESNGYDAGTELNTEDFADIVPPCPALTGVPSSDPGTGMSNPALAEHGVIQHHPGIQGTADLLLDPHAWSDPVARITVERIQ